MNAYKILIADDDELIIDVLRNELEREGYQTIVCFDGEAALHLARTEQPDLVLLDVMMPKQNGWEVCRALRAESTVPILMLTARGEEMDRVMGLKYGADDYIVKPFGLLELLARVEAILRRSSMAKEANPEEPHETMSDAGDVDEQHQVVIGNALVDFDKHMVIRDGQSMPITVKEFNLIKALLAADGAVVSRNTLMNQVWSYQWVGDTRTIDVHIRRLRQKIEDDDKNPKLILTVRGVGYRLLSVSERVEQQE